MKTNPKTKKLLQVDAKKVQREANHLADAVEGMLEPIDVTSGGQEARQGVLSSEEVVGWNTPLELEVITTVSENIAYAVI